MGNKVNEVLYVKRNLGDKIFFSFFKENTKRKFSNLILFL